MINAADTTTSMAIAMRIGRMLRMSVVCEPPVVVCDMSLAETLVVFPLVVTVSGGNELMVSGGLSDS